MSDDPAYPSELNSPPTALEVIKFSENCWYWWLSRDDWINRKVLQLTHIDRETFEAETTYDINFSRVRQISEQFSTNTTDRILLPLDMLQQRPYMTTGLDSPWGRQTCLATREEKSRFATLLFFGLLQEFNDFPADALDDDLVYSLYLSMLDSASYDIKDDAKLLTFLSHFNEANQQGLIEVVEWLRSSFMVCISLPKDNKVEITRGQFKFSYIGGGWRPQSRLLPDRRTPMTLFDNLGVTSSSMVVAGVNLDQDFAAHMRIMVPPGMRVDKVRYEGPDKATAADFDGVVLRKNNRVVSVYAPQRCQTPFNVRIFMNPERSIFVIPALLSSLVSLIVAQLVAVAFLYRPKNNWDMSSTITLVALVPAFISSYIIVANEHETVRFALGLRRLALSVGAIASVIFASVLVFGMADRTGGYYVQTVMFIQVAVQATLVTFFLFDILRVETWRRGLGGLLSNYNPITGLSAALLLIFLVVMLRVNSALMFGVKTYCDYILCVLTLSCALIGEHAIVFMLSSTRQSRLENS